MAKKVLLTDDITGDALDTLKNEFEVTVGSPGYYNNEDRLAEDIAYYDALLSMLTNPVSERVLKNGENLKVVANYAVGYDNIDVHAAQKLGIKVCNTPGVLTEATADLAMALLLSTARNLPQSEHYLRQGHFIGWEPKGFLGLELRDATLGIIGMGRIGQAMARRAKGFGMHICYHNRNPLPPEQLTGLEAEYVDHVNTLAERADVLSLHCPLTPQTRHLIDQNMLDRMPGHALLINTARGPVVDEQALAQALHEGDIGGAGLDVFEQEPQVHPDLLSAPNCTMAPHIGSATHRTRKQMTHLAVTAIIDILQGKTRPQTDNLVV